MKHITVSLLLGVLALAVNASDLQREERLKNQIIDAIFDGESFMLEAEGHEFLSIYTEADDPRGAVLVLHGRGFHPDYANVVNPLRVGLAEAGWNTLAIQLPVLDKAAKYYDYVPVFGEAMPRIDAALDYLRAQGNQKIVVVAHSCGAHMAMHYVRQKGSDGFDAYIGIGMGATDYRQPMREPFPLDRMRIPVLDVYGGDDYPAVHRLAAIRAQQLQGEGNPLNQQRVVPEADHYFVDRGDALLEVISQWLEQL
jgi:dienelactone hydrolase